MVEEAEIPRWGGKRPGGCIVTKDKYGTCWTIPTDHHKDPRLTCPAVEVWWDRSTAGEYLILRQGNVNIAPQVITLTLAQLYAGIEAFNRALEGV